MAPRGQPSTSLDEAQDLLKASNRILALCGAGLSAASGLPTFRGAGGLWRNHDATKLATPTAFKRDPALVWLFYAWRRHLALSAEPNDGHRALAELARKKENFLCLTQNVDRLSLRADHPEDKLRQLHGSLFDIKCFNRACGYVEKDNFADPLCPALQPASAANNTSSAVGHRLPLLDPDSPLPAIDTKDLPHCPKCKTELLRPGVVWFEEPLDGVMLDGVDEWVAAADIDVVMVVGTTAEVYPAASYVTQARIKGGARVVVVNPDPESMKGLGRDDFWFQGDAATILPQLISQVTDVS